MWMNGNMRSVRVPVSQFTLPVLWKQLSTWCWKSAGRRVGWIPQPSSRARLWLCLHAWAPWRGPLWPGGRALCPAAALASLLLPLSLSLPACPRSCLPAERRAFAGSTPASHVPSGAASRSLTCLSGFHPWFLCWWLSTWLKAFPQSPTLSFLSLNSFWVLQSLRAWSFLVLRGRNRFCLWENSDQPVLCRRPSPLGVPPGKPPLDY